VEADRVIDAQCNFKNKNSNRENLIIRRVRSRKGGGLGLFENYYVDMEAA